jgi:hypothetical protein
VTRNPEYVDATDLDSFAWRREAQELLPHLIRRLLTCTPGVTNVSVRAGDSIGMTGWDGRADGGTGSSFVPPGASAWELGTGNDPRAKAQRDYRNRTDDPLGVDPATTAFVVATLRTWDEADRNDWLRARNAEGVWRTVVALDADDLHGWLEATLAVHIWLSEQMGRRPQDVQTLELWWQHWAGATQPALPTDLVLAGRQAQAQELRGLLGGMAAVHGIHGQSREESLTFAAAALLTPGASDNTEPPNELLPPVLVVSSSHQWARFTDAAAPVGLVPEFTPTGSDVAAVVRAGHHAILPMGPDEDPSRAAVVIPRIGRDQGRDALLAAGWPFEHADRDAAQARRSLQSLRRDPRLAVSPQFERPPWAQRPAADAIAPLVLVGGWQAIGPSGDPSVGDRQLVADVAGVNYDILERDLHGWAQLGDPPLRRSGRGWRLSAPLDAWTLLHNVLTRSDLERWSSATLEVLCETDPVLTLPNDERPYASLRGKQRTWSGQLRRGLAQGAALLGAAGDDELADGRTAGEHGATVVRKLLARANDDATGATWRSLSDVLALLAEAAPDQFLDGVESGLADDPPLLVSMFTDKEDSGIWSSASPHTGLLWALETLCWSSSHLSRAADALARLAMVDPGGRQSNRPAESLRRIFLPWMPRTVASPERRLSFLAGLVERRPDIGYRLVESLLPTAHDLSHATSSPRFRDWRPDREGAGIGEQLEVISGLVDLILQGAEREPVRWPDLIPKLSELPPGDLARCLDALASVPPDTLAAGSRLALWNQLTELAARHRQFPDAAWVLPDATLLRLEAFAAHLEPTGIAQRHARLFEWRPDLPGTDKYDLAEYDAALADARSLAVEDSLALDGVDALLRLADASTLPGALGAVTADVGREDLGKQILRSLHFGGRQREFAMGWAARTAELRGRQWTDETTTSLRTAPGPARSSFYLSLPNEPHTWSLVDADALDVQDQYWHSVAYFGVAPEDAEALAERLLERRRPWSTIDFLALRCHGNDDDAKPAAELIDRALRGALGPDTVETPRPGSLDYDLGVLLDRLAVLGTVEETMFELEWAYFPVLKDSREPQAIYARLARDPNLFVEAVCLTYRTHNDTAEPSLNKADRSRAGQCWNLLRTWRRVPGTREDGSIDTEHLMEWVRGARSALAEHDRADIGDECLGEMLSGCPAGDDGAWPCVAVRNIVEAAESTHLETGLMIGRFNDRGVTTRGVYDGGHQEAELAAKYRGWAEMVGDRWPRTGRLLNQMADNYDRDARREDQSAEGMSDEG